MCIRAPLRPGWETPRRPPTEPSSVRRKEQHFLLRWCGGPAQPLAEGPTQGSGALCGTGALYPCPGRRRSPETAHPVPLGAETGARTPSLPRSLLGIGGRSPWRSQAPSASHASGSCDGLREHVGLIVLPPAPAGPARAFTLRSVWPHPFLPQAELLRLEGATLERPGSPTCCPGHPPTGDTCIIWKRKKLSVSP